MTGEARQTWCALCSWPGRKPFLVGTFTTPARAPQAEAEAAALAEWASEMAEILPVGVAAPEVIRLVPGAIVFHPREDQ